MLSNRRKLYSIRSYNNNFIKQTNPWIVAWWSSSFPGFGHILLGDYLLGYILMLFELTVNNLAKINKSICYSMLGNFHLAKSVINKDWFLAYMGIYIFCVYDGYRRSVEYNEAYILAYRDKQELNLFNLSSLGITSLNRISPLISVLWSAVTPGISAIYFKNIPTCIFSLFWMGVISFKAHLFKGIQYSFVGEFSKAIDVLDSQWLLFFPSVYVFVLYHSYILAVYTNKSYDLALSGYLKADFQDIDFRLPLEED